jgi:glycine/D-amino acid oxidase-like deaminating enzyme
LTGTRGSRLTIIGGGVMGLMTAYYAAPLATSVTVLDKSRVGDPDTASFGLTRTFLQVEPELPGLEGQPRVRGWPSRPGSSGSTCRNVRVSGCWSTAAA